MHAKTEVNPIQQLRSGNVGYREAVNGNRPYHPKGGKNETLGIHLQ